MLPLVAFILIFIYFRNWCGAHYIWWTFYVAGSYVILRWSTLGPWKCGCCPFFFLSSFLRISFSLPVPFDSRNTHSNVSFLSLAFSLSLSQKKETGNKTKSTDSPCMRMFILVSLTDPLHFGFNPDHWASKNVLLFREKTKDSWDSMFLGRCSPGISQVAVYWNDRRDVWVLESLRVTFVLFIFNRNVVS